MVVRCTRMNQQTAAAYMAWHIQKCLQNVNPYDEFQSSKTLLVDWSDTGLGLALDKEKAMALI